MTDAATKYLPEQRDETPREREYRKQINDLHVKLSQTRVHYEKQIDGMRRARTPAQTAVKDMEQHTKGLRVLVEKLEADLAAAKAEHNRFEERIKAGQDRRREMVITLNALLTCEDDAGLSESAYEARMDAVVRRARLLVSAEKAAMLPPKGGG